MPHEQLQAPNDAKGTAAAGAQTKQQEQQQVLTQCNQNRGRCPDNATGTAAVLTLCNRNSSRCPDNATGTAAGAKTMQQ